MSHLVIIPGSPGNGKGGGTTTSGAAGGTSLVLNDAERIQTSRKSTISATERQNIATRYSYQ
jgi:hypothetical protein